MLLCLEYLHFKIYRSSLTAYMQETTCVLWRVCLFSESEREKREIILGEFIANDRVHMLQLT
jgi:hypothetical protein